MATGCWEGAKKCKQVIKYIELVLDDLKTSNQVNPKSKLQRSKTWRQANIRVCIETVRILGGGKFR